MKIINKTASFCKRLTHIGGAARSFKASIQDYPEEKIKNRNRENCIKISPKDLSWENIHPETKENDNKLLERICDAYVSSKKNQPKTGIYALSGMWKGIIDLQYGEMIQAATQKDLIKLNMILKNMFRRNSLGLSMSGDVPAKFSPRSLRGYLNNYVDSLLRLAIFVNIREISKDMDNEFFLSEEKISAESLWKKICKIIKIEPCYPSGGNPFGLICHDKGKKFAIPKVAFRHLYTALRVHELIKMNKRSSILEIGGGFGGIIYYILKLNRKAKHLNIKSIDIPEVNIISSYFLAKAIPEVRIYLYGETVRETNSQTIQIMPNWMIEKIPSGSIDLVINEDSFPEMPSKTMAKYLQQIGRIAKCFYSINQDSGRLGQNRLSQVEPDVSGLKCEQNNLSWMRRGYFEKLFRSNSFNGNVIDKVN